MNQGPTESFGAEPPSNAGVRFYAAVEDIFFAAKITAAAKRVGVAVEFLRDESKLIAAVCSAPAVVLVDLNNGGMKTVELVKKLKGSGAPALQVIGYLSHVQTELMREAQKAGCDLVLPRSVFSQQLDELLRQRSCHQERC